MADFCKACSLEIFGGDLGDLADITTEEQGQKGLAAVVFCEGYGPIQVDSKETEA